MNDTTPPPLPMLGNCQRCGSMFVGDDWAPYCSEACKSQEAIYPVFSPLEEEDREGQRYGVLLQTRYGLIGVNWWPMSTEPTVAMAEMLTQVGVLGPEPLQRLTLVISKALTQTMYGALVREAEKEGGEG